MRNAHRQAARIVVVEPIKDGTTGRVPTLPETRKRRCCQLWLAALWILMLTIPWPYCGNPENNDQWIHRHVFPNKQIGYFVELGAADGVSGSSCHLLECIGWRGICVEPCSAFFPQLCHNRPKAICENVCVFDCTGFVRFHEDRFLSRVVPETHELQGQDRSMPAITLGDLLGKHQAPKVIDYLAMDVEGSERRILSVFPFDQYRVLAISMEGDNARDILRDNHFVKVRNPFNTVCPWETHYVHQSVVYFL